MNRHFFISLILIFFLLPICSLALTFQTNDQSSFDEGTYDNTVFDVSGYVELSGSFTSGTYTSKVFDATAQSQWDTITWTETLPYGDDLPDNKGSDAGADMTGNLLLMHLDETSGTIADTSGEGNAATNNGATYGTDGVFSTSLYFDNAGDAVESNSYTYTFTTEMTLLAWYKQTGSGAGSPRIVEISKTGNADSHCLAPDGDGSVRAWAECSNGNRVGSVDDSTKYNDGNWHFMVYTYKSSDSPQGRLYMDGVQTDTGTGSCSDLDDGAYLILGAISDNSGQYQHNQHYFRGYVDEVAVFNRVLSATEILNIYKRGVMRLGIDVRSCDDAICTGESWTSITDESPQSLSLSNNNYFQYKFNFERDVTTYNLELSDVSVDYTLLYTCGSNGCEYDKGEDYTVCAQDCCKSDGTACAAAGDYTSCTSDNTCHQSCHNINGATVSSECYNQDTSGGNQCVSLNEGFCDTSCSYNACPGCSDCTGGSCTVNDHTECSGITSSCSCITGSCSTCSSGQYCSSVPVCTDCSTSCDGICVSASCYGTDPDCDISGSATLTCCGNSKCEGGAGETCENCIADCGVCPLYCGDSSCDASKGENTCTCSQDCGSCSGDAPGTCKEYSCVGGNCTSVSKDDCCGNGVCEEGESYSNCPNDCSSVCGDNYCDTVAGENTCTCSLDCGTCGGDAPGTCKEYGCVSGNCTSVSKENCCGNSVCEYGESYSNCQDDCQSVCGDAYCDAAGGENTCSCSLDCGSCSGDAPGTCNQYACLGDNCTIISKTGCCGNSVCETGESYTLCEADCPPQCGDGACDVGDGENRCNCPLDCGYCSGPAPGNCKEFKCDEGECISADSIYCCGNGQCDPNENAQNCPADCQGECGDKICDASLGENECTCAVDCGICDIEFPEKCFKFACNEKRRCVRVNMTDCCGNTVCEIEENSKTCAIDCNVVCGDGRCEIFANETCENCADDCGECPPYCGDKKCNAGENTCNCATDCGTCDGTCGTCRELQCFKEQCVCLPILFCCGNLRCEVEESFSACPDDCHPKSLVLSFITPKQGERFMRGDTITISVNVTLDKHLPAKSVKISALTSLGLITLFDDGKHNDGAVNDGIYGGTLPIFSNTLPDSFFFIELQGTYASKTNASVAMMYSSANQTIDVTNRLLVDVTFSKEGYNLTETLSAMCGVKDIFSKDIPAKLYFDLYNKDGVLVSDQQNILTSSDCNFEYRTTLLDTPGRWRLQLKATDTNNNTGLINSIIRVDAPQQKDNLDITIESPLSAEYAKGKDITFSVLVHHNGESIADAEVVAHLPDLPPLMLNSLGGGKYSKFYTLPWDYPYENIEIQIKATKKRTDSVIAGQESVKIYLVSSKVTIEMIEPKKASFRKGEKVNFVFKLTYPDGTPVKKPKIDILVDEQKIQFESTEEGLFSAEYLVPEESGDVSVKVDVDDGYGAVGDTSLELVSEGVSTAFVLKTYKELIVGVIVIILLGALYGSYKVQLQFRIGRLTKRIKELERLEEELQTHYFDDGAISRSEFETLFDKYDNELAEINAKLDRLKK